MKTNQIILITIIAIIASNVATFFVATSVINSKKSMRNKSDFTSQNYNKQKPITTSSSSVLNSTTQPTTQNNQTSNLQTFSDPSLPNFSFQYPNDWQINFAKGATDPEATWYAKTITGKKDNLNFEIFLNDRGPSGIGLPSCFGNDKFGNTYELKRYNNFTSQVQKGKTIDFDNKEVPFNSTTFFKNSQIAIKGEPEFERLISNYKKISSIVEEDFTNKIVCDQDQPIPNILTTKATGITNDKTGAKIDKMYVGSIKSTNIDPKEVEQIAVIIDSIKGLN